MTTIATSPRLIIPNKTTTENNNNNNGIIEPKLNYLPEVLIIHIGKFLDFNSLALNFSITSKHVLISLSSIDADRNLWRILAICLVPNVIFSAYSMNLPSGFSSWKKMVTRSYFLNKIQWIKAKAAEKAVISEKKESRSTYSFLIDTRRNVLYRVGGHYFFTVNELNMHDIELDITTSLIGTTAKWKKIRAIGVPPNPLRYFSFTCVPWQSSITEMPCSPLFRIGGADASFPYSEHISIVIMLPFQQNDDGNNNNNNNNTKKIKWRWVRPEVRGNLPPPRRSHSCTYIDGSDGHRIVMYGGGSSTDGIKNFGDLWILDTYNESTFVDYMRLKNQPPPKSYKASIDNINVLWTKPKINSNIPQSCSGRFGHASMYISGIKFQELLMKYKYNKENDDNNIRNNNNNNNNNYEGKVENTPAIQNSFGILIFGGMAFAGSLGMHDIHTVYCNDKNAVGDKLLFEWKELVPTGGSKYGPPKDIKGHSITYIGNKLIILGGDRRTNTTKEKKKKKMNVDTDGGSSSSSSTNYNNTNVTTTTTTTTTTTQQQNKVNDMKVVESKLNALTVKDDERKDQEKEEEVEATTTTTTTMPPIKIHILDVVNQKWYIPKNVGDYAPTNRSGHGAELWGGQVVLTGGYDNSDKGAIDRTSRLVKTDAERLVVL